MKRLKEIRIDELSSDLLDRYKKKAGEHATSLDKAGGRPNIEKANKRFSGILKATKKQFANDVKEEVEQIDELKTSTLVRYGTKASQSAHKLNDNPAKREKREAAINRSIQKVKQQYAKEEVESLEEGRPSQRHPLEGHDYHKKSDDVLVYIAKDAHRAAEAMKGHNEKAENKYRDQANDSATVRYWRKKNGMPNWYKKKYGHVKEEVEQIEEIHTPGTKVKVAHNGKMVSGKVVRHDKGEKHGSSFYVVDVGGYESKKVPSHQVQKEEVEQIDEISDETKKSYLEKSKAQVKELTPHAKSGEYKDLAKNIIARRKKGIQMASEEIEGVAEGLNEMDKSAPQPGRDGKVSHRTYGSRDRDDKNNYFKGKEAPGKAITAKQASKDALNILKKQGVAEETEEKPPFDKPYKKAEKQVTDKSGAVHTPMSRAKDVARKAMRGMMDKQKSSMKESVEELQESRKSEIIKEAMKKKKKKVAEEDKFQPEPEIQTTFLRSQND